MRMGVSGLAVYVSLTMGYEPTDNGTWFLFCGTKKYRIRGLFYNTDNLSLTTHSLNGQRRQDATGLKKSIIKREIGGNSFFLTIRKMRGEEQALSDRSDRLNPCSSA